MEIALIADDGKKELMAQFCIAYSGILSKHHICATQTTGKYVKDTLYITNGLLDGSLKGEPASMPWRNGEMKFHKISYGLMASYCYNPDNF